MKKGIQREQMHKCNVSKVSLTDKTRKPKKNQLLDPHERYLAEISGIISNNLNLIFEFLSIVGQKEAEGKATWHKFHLRKN